MKDWVDDLILYLSISSLFLKDQVQFDSMMPLACFSRDMELFQANFPQLLSWVEHQTPSSPFIFFDEDHHN